MLIERSQFLQNSSNLFIDSYKSFAESANRQCHQQTSLVNIQLFNMQESEE